MFDSNEGVQQCFYQERTIQSGIQEYPRNWGVNVSPWETIGNDECMEGRKGKYSAHIKRYER